MIDARKISELPETNIMKDSSCMPIAQDGETKKISFADLKWLFKGDKGEPGEKGEKGDTGVSIDRITVEESDVDGGENKIIILKDNGQAVTFIIRNGSKGVTMRNRGTWESGVEYENGVTYLDIVYYPETGCSYVCNTSHTSGAILPTDTNYWTLLSLRGEKGDKGDKGEKGDTGAVATVVQNTGDSLDNVMSQKAVTEALRTKSPQSHNHDDRYYTEDEVNTKVNQLKSDLVAKDNMLSYEEIMASTPPIDLDVAVPKASVLKSLKKSLSDFSALVSNYGIYGVRNIDDLYSYPRGEGILHFSSFSNSFSTGTFPFPDGHLLSLIWRNTDAGGGIITQLAIEDNDTIIKIRSYNISSWSSWKSVSIS